MKVKMFLFMQNLNSFFPPLSICPSLFTSTTWSWFAVHISWFTRATNSCLMRSWWPSGRPQTTATAAVTLPPSWSSKTWTQGSPSYSGPFLIRKGSYHLERQHPTSSEVFTVACVQPSPFHCSVKRSFMVFNFSVAFFFFLQIFL